ncbi:nucleoside hydrolase [Skermanella stibiiresistens]|uniref:nucleoside hydrolase n=1 Tax=Skermanella stibiiresistens TaxID=913326 RepID=UPI0004AC685F|nr:nucleoside hydrolase [Skermanella stibiiresistens]
MRQSVTPRPIIIDTDPGQDDAVALLLALAAPEELEILGITVVAGNVPLPLTVRNTLKICELAGKPEIPVYAGCARPMMRRSVTAEQVHGKTGLDGPDLPEPVMRVRPGHGVDFMVDTLMAAHDASVTLCMLGPLTNLGMALVKEPAIVTKIREVVLMGGAWMEVGNVTPASEFNIHVDPHAAHNVFASGVPITVMPLDVTHKALTTRERVARFRALGTPVGTAVADLLGFFERFDEAKYGTDGAPLHDPCVIAWLLRPDLFQGRRVAVEIETGSERTMGMTVVDWWGVSGQPANALVINQIDSDGFFDLLTTRLASL